MMGEGAHGKTNVQEDCRVDGGLHGEMTEWAGEWRNECVSDGWTGEGWVADGLLGE